mmetsp:Transcript_15730/g.23040  ORF Transcript_15730/g.23040 Transcript_15730/m.23040 type:complete len:200 (+) Transcript_15730:160-759(+)
MASARSLIVICALFMFIVNIDAFNVRHERGNKDTVKKSWFNFYSIENLFPFINTTSTEEISTEPHGRVLQPIISVPPTFTPSANPTRTSYPSFIATPEPTLTSYPSFIATPEPTLTSYPSYIATPEPTPSTLSTSIPFNLPTTNIPTATPTSLPASSSSPSFATTIVPSGQQSLAPTQSSYPPQEICTCACTCVVFPCT